MNEATPWSRTNQLIIAAAAGLGVEAEAIASEHSDFFLRLRWPGPPPRAVIVSKTRSPFLTQVAQTLANNKFASRELLAGEGLPVITSALFDEAHDPRVHGHAATRARAQLSAHGRVVVKPNWGNRGLGITTAVTGFDELCSAYALARAYDRDEEVLVEPFVAGINLRVTVIGGRVAAAAELRRPQLRGDGCKTAAALLAELNADPRRASWDRPRLVALDRIEPEQVAERLAVAGLELDEVVPSGVRVELSFEEIEVVDRSDELDPGWAAVAIAAAGGLGVDVAGVDLRGPAEVLLGGAELGSRRAGVLEVNALPALHLHALPTSGRARPVFEDFVAYCLQLPGAPPVCAQVRV
ncbi:Glutathione biosynthesis bifunctional protein GshAB [Enhygromyxa salina]|uniref:Glutathione biosynthesis bifunctional protein GshAB n=1 Tax=Enhygromyxa salina TaxID=215803 RepID=A0A2S9Y4H1_9BACT|nr:hypothetical protein [Enhygromyxa salina]PRP99999.1 Glutathione biosynthesis bifunctional protein GshAB [Enhygromyxa salina]